MRILLLAPFIYPFATGGMEIYSFYFVKELLKLGVQSSLLSYQISNMPKELKQYKLYTKNAFLQSIQIFIHLLFYRYDIVHVPYASNSFLAYPLGLYKKFFNSNDYIIYIHGGGMDPWKKPRIQKLFFDKAKKILSVSEPIKNEYETRVKKEVTTILPLIPYESPERSPNDVRTELGIEKDEKLLIYVGSIKPMKGSDFLIDSLIQLGIDFFLRHKIKMFFIGDGESRNELEQKVLNNKMDEFIYFLGKKLKEDVPDYLSAADFFINASHFEGTPLSILEAMYNNLVIISTNVRGINNFIENKINGLLFEKDNFLSFKETLEFALLNPALCNDMKKQAKEVTLRNFDYIKNIKRHLEIYAQ